MTTRLFVYGTLAPDGPQAAARDGWEPDHVRGRLFDLGPYPALVDCDNPAAGWVEGFVRAFDFPPWAALDAYEGVDEGLYRRRPLLTRRGRDAWVYVYARPLPRGARGPLPRWTGRRVGWDAIAPDFAAPLATSASTTEPAVTAGPPPPPPPSNRGVDP